MTDSAGPADSATPLRVVVAGGGVAALETVLALRALAGDRVTCTVLTPAPEYVDRPMTVREPFAYAPAARHELAEIVPAMGARLVPDGFGWVDPVLRVAHSAGGQELPYDALVLAIGARMRGRFAHAVTIDDRVLDGLLHGLVQDVEGGHVHEVAFVVPERMAWPLPIYELALMTAERAFDMSARLQVTIVTPEEAPLAVFGAGASDALRGLLSDAGITLITSTRADVPSSRQVTLGSPRDTLEVDRVISLPELIGPAVRGLPGGAHGFIPVDPYGRVKGVEDVYAAGDATDYPIKHGGIATQQADTLAVVIAARAGAPVTPQPLRAEIHGMLLTGREPRYLSARAAGSHGFASTVSDTPSWPSGAKVASVHLAPFLESLAAAGRPTGKAMTS